MRFGAQHDDRVDNTFHTVHLYYDVATCNRAQIHPKQFFRTGLRQAVE